MVDPEAVQALRVIDDWPVDHAAAAVVQTGREPQLHGDVERAFALASVTKVLVAFATWIAVEEGSITLADSAGPDGSTIRHLLAHASGLSPDSDAVLAPPGTRRIYSNRGFEVLGDVVAHATGMSVARYLHEAVCEPLGLRSTRLDGSTASGAVSSVADLCAVTRELLQPSLVARETLTEATAVAFPGLDGVLPGFGRQSPNDWGLGVERRGTKDPHWTGASNSPDTFGHFGQAGTMLWVDPAARTALICLTDRDFGPWAAHAWPVLSDGVVAEAHT